MPLFFPMENPRSAMRTLPRNSRKWPNENPCFSGRIRYGHPLSYVFSVHVNQICKEFWLHLSQVDNRYVMMRASRSPRAHFSSVVVDRSPRNPLGGALECVENADSWALPLTN